MPSDREIEAAEREMRDIEGFQNWSLESRLSAADLILSAATARPDRDPEKLAQRFHEAYERLAPDFGYQTRTASAVPWEDVPEQNKRLMIAVCAELVASLGEGEGGR